MVKGEKKMTDVITENTRAIVRIIKLIKLAALILFLITAVFVVLDVLIITGEQAKRTRDDINDYKDDPSLPETGGLQTYEFIPTSDVENLVYKVEPADGIVFDKINNTWALKSETDYVEVKRDETPDNFVNVTMGSDLNTSLYYSLLNVKAFGYIYGVGTPLILSVKIAINGTLIYDDDVINSTMPGAFSTEVDLEGHYNITENSNITLYFDCEKSVTGSTVKFRVGTVSLMATGMFADIIYVNITETETLIDTETKKKKVYVDPTLADFIEAYGVYLGMIMTGMVIGSMGYAQRRIKKSINKKKKTGSILDRLF